MQLTPLSYHFLASVHEGQDSSLVLPEGAELQPYAKVLDIGPDVKNFSVGDRVLFNPRDVIFADTIDGEKIVIAPASCVFAKYIDQNVPNN